MCRARTKTLSLQAQFAHSPANPVGFEEGVEGGKVGGVVRRKRSGKGHGKKERVERVREWRSE